MWEYDVLKNASAGLGRGEFLFYTCSASIDISEPSGSARLIIARVQTGRICPL
jgi:hypothetical protein